MQRLLGCSGSLAIEMLLIKVEHFKNNHRSEEIPPYVLVMFGGVVLGPLVGEISITRSPIDAELALAFVVSEPVEMHVHCFGAFWLDFAVYDCISHSIVHLEGCCRLLMAEFLQNDSDVDSLAHCYEEGCELSFGG